MKKLLISSAAASGLMAGGAWAAEKIVIVTSFPEEMTAVIEKAFEGAHPEYDIEILNKSTSSGVKYIQEIASANTADIFWASAPDAFEVLKGDGKLAKITPNVTGIPDVIGSYPMNDAEGHYYGFAASGYGIMWNTRYVEGNGLPPAKEWADLEKPEYFGHVYNTETCRDGFQAVKHANGRDYWLVQQDFDTSAFITFLYTPNGFYGPYFQNVNIPLFRGGTRNAIFNRQGTKFATTAWNNKLMLFDFDRCTGQFTYTNKVDPTWQYLGYSFCFSAKGNKIYRLNNSDQIYQYDTADVDFNISRDTVAIYDGYFDVDSTKFGYLYLAADDKIYINSA